MKLHPYIITELLDRANAEDRLGILICLQVGFPNHGIEVMKERLEKLLEEKPHLKSLQLQYEMQK